MGHTSSETEALLDALGARFAAHTHRHPGLSWSDVEARLLAQPAKLEAVFAMEQSGGEPDAVVFGGAQLAFVDCAPESPLGRRSLCFDREGWESRKEHRPAGSAAELAEAMGIELLNEAEYHALQQFGEFDLKTSSWLKTPADIRALGGALFGDRRFGRVFVYHNGAQSYYGARGFRGIVRL